MSETELWKETREVVRAAKAGPLFPKKRKEVKEFIKNIRNLLREAFSEAA